MRNSLFRVSCRTFAIGVVLLLSFRAKADVTLPQIFRDHMVIQRDKPIRVWGWAAPNERVTALFADNSRSTKADKLGKWMVTFTAQHAGGPFELVVQGKNKIALSDILVGDVWICGGQSNMAWQLQQTDFRETDSLFLSANEMRLFTVDMAMDYVPREDLSGTGWRILRQENIEAFSAVAYHFGKRIQKESGIPIGLISVNLGATSVETWMSNEALLNFPQFEEEIRPVVQRGKSFAELRYDFERNRDEWYWDSYYNGVGISEQWFRPETDVSGWKDIVAAGNTWEGEPALKDFDGAVWFRKTFDVPADYAGGDLLIQLGQIDDHDIAWVNGEKIGETFGRHNHRNYSVPEEDLKPKDNALVIRVFDDGGLGGFTTNPFWAGSILKGSWLYRPGSPLNPAQFSPPVLPNATPFSSPGVLYNGMIAPLTSLHVKGAIWYQGESNAGRAYEYRDLFPAMINDWRKHWGQDDFPFLFVQLANYMAEPSEPVESAWAELREAQAMALALPNTGMATAIDIGEANDIHPKNKEDVGKRLALAALKVAYGRENIVASGPVFRKMEIKGDKVVIFFDHAGSGLIAKDKYGYIRGFQMASSDRKFFWAQASIEGDCVVVSSSKVRDPVAVRYAWADNPGELDLYNVEGLPALPFRTDTWSGKTEGKVFSDGPRF